MQDGVGEGYRGERRARERQREREAEKDKKMDV